MAPLLNYQEYFIPCTNVKLINKDDRGGGGGGSLWPRAMCNDDNPMSDNHPGTVTLLTSETYTSYHILTKGKTGKGEKQANEQEQQEAR